MESLRALMSLVDANSHNVPEGDYLAMCDALKVVHGNMKPERVNVRSMVYYELEDELMKVTQELMRLHKDRNATHYVSRITKDMRTRAIHEYTFREGLHSIREFTVDALKEAGVRIDFDDLFRRFVEAHNDQIYEKKKAIHLMIEEARGYRDELVSRMANEL
jgi:aryl carrier-like protein